MDYSLDPNAHVDNVNDNVLQVDLCSNWVNCSCFLLVFDSKVRGDSKQQKFRKKTEKMLCCLLQPLQMKSRLLTHSWMAIMQLWRQIAIVH